jgi:hypothetical protein
VTVAGATVSPGPQSAAGAAEPDGEPVGPIVRESKWLDCAKGIAGAMGNVFRSSGPGNRLSIALVGALVEWAKRAFPEERHQPMSAAAEKAGHWAMLAAQVLAVVLGIAAAAKFGRWTYIAVGIGLLLALVMAQYVADRFLRVAARFADGVEPRIGSTAWNESAAVLFEILGLMAFFGAVFRCRMVGQWSLIWKGIGIWAVLDAFAYTALHPSLTRTQIRGGLRASEEAAGMINWVAALAVKAAPMAYGLAATFGVVGLFFGTLSLMRTGLPVAALAGLRLVVHGAAIPFLVCVAFALCRAAAEVLERSRAE